jgi:hypothetical protein
MLAMLDRFRGRGVKARLLNPVDELWDRRLGVRTFGYHPSTGQQGDSEWRLHYTPAPYGDIFRLLEMVGLREDDVFVDLGSGLGRAVFAASWMGARRSIGVEIVEQLCEKAEENRRGSRLAGQNIQFICTHAANYRFGDATVLFIFHSFGEPTLRQVLSNIEADRAQGPRGSLRIIYLNPVFDGVLQETGWLRPIGRAPAATKWFSTANRYQATLWQSVPSDLTVTPPQIASG